MTTPQNGDTLENGNFDVHHRVHHATLCNSFFLIFGHFRVFNEKT